MHSALEGHEGARGSTKDVPPAIVVVIVRLYFGTVK